MKRLLSGIILGAFCGVLMLGCGQKATNIDVVALGNDLNTQITYQDELAQMDVDTASMFLNLAAADIVSSSIYEGSGATAEEIVVLECSSKEEADKAKTILTDRVEEQIDSFTDYVPEELDKLNKAVIRTTGNYAILSVSNDPNKANSIIDSYLK